MDVPTHFHFTHRRLVEFAETDLAGIMHFSNYLRFVESAEHAFFRALGCGVLTTDGATHHGWPRIDLTCRYFSPARFEQTLEVGLRLAEIRTSGLSYGFWIFHAGAPHRTLLAAGSTAIVHASFNPATGAMRKAPIPSAVRRALERAMVTPPTPS